MLLIILDSFLKKRGGKPFGPLDLVASRVEIFDVIVFEMSKCRFYSASALERILIERSRSACQFFIDTPALFTLSYN